MEGSYFLVLFPAYFFELTERRGLSCDSWSLGRLAEFFWINAVVWLAAIRLDGLQQELQAHSVSLLAFQSVRPSNFQECRNVGSPAQKSNFTAHDRAGGKKPIAEHADSAFSNVLSLTLKILLGLFGRFQHWE